MNLRQTAAQKLADFICDLDNRHIPVDAFARCRDLLLDQLGCQLIGASMQWNQPVYRFVKDTKSGGPARIIKYGDRVPLDDAVLVNGTFAQGCELDDYYDQRGGHPGAASVPVILALAQKQRVSGPELITAKVAAYEVGWRVGRALLPEIMRRGYHGVGVRRDICFFYRLYSRAAFSPIIFVFNASDKSLRSITSSTVWGNLKSLWL